MIPGEPVATSEADFPQEFLNQASVACRDVECLERAYVGWLKPWPDPQSKLEPGAKLTIVLHYGAREPNRKRFPWRPFTGDLVFVDDGELHVLPDLNVIHAHGRALEGGIEQRWVRVF